MNFELVPRPFLIRTFSSIGPKSSCPSVVDIRIIDPEGNRLGYDINGMLYEEIPDGEYHETPGCDDSVYVLNPLSGTYVIEVVADRNYIPQPEDNPNYTLDVQIGGSPPDTLVESAAMPEGSVDTLGYYVGPTLYICGDANDDETVNISDAVAIINYIFVGGDPPDPIASGDVNCDGVCNISDAVAIINYIFVGGNEPCDTTGDGEPDC